MWCFKMCSDFYLITINVDCNLWLCVNRLVFSEAVIAGGFICDSWQRTDFLTAWSWKNLAVLHGNCDAGQCIHVLNIHLEYIYVKGLTE